MVAKQHWEVRMSERGQDKRAEVNEGGILPGEVWLEDTRVIRAKKRHLQLLLSLLDSGALVLDAGCGPGTYGMILAEMGHTVVGIDISHRAVSIARERAQGKAVNFSPVAGDLEWLPFRDQGFEACFSGWVLHHLPDIRPALAELRRVLKPGGRIFLVEPNESSRPMRLSRLAERAVRPWILKAGWDTPNRSTHLYTDYGTVLEGLNFRDITISSCFAGRMPPLPLQPEISSMVIPGLLRVAAGLRSLCMDISSRILRGHLDGPELLITALRDGDSRLSKHAT